MGTAAVAQGERLSVGARTCRAWKGGHLELLRWARENGCPWNADTCGTRRAAGSDLLRWARENGCPCDVTAVWSSPRLLPEGEAEPLVRYLLNPAADERPAHDPP